MVFFDVNYEEGEVKVSPPLKYFSPEFLTKLVDITTQEGGLVAINTIIDDSANRHNVVQNLRGLAGCVKFSSKMDEEKNEVIYLARGTFDKKSEDCLDDTQNRLLRMTQAINTLKLPKSVFAKMKVSSHVEQMRRL